MKNPLTPGKSTPVKSWTDFALLARDARHFDTTVIEVASSPDHATLLKMLNGLIRSDSGTIEMRGLALF